MMRTLASSLVTGLVLGLVSAGLTASPVLADDVAGEAVVIGGDAATTGTIELKNGDKITGTISEQPDGSVVVENAIVGRVVISADQIAEPEPPEPPTHGLFGSRFLEGWKRRIGLGLSGSDGENKTMEVNLAGGMNYEDESFRHDLRGAYFFSTKNDVTADNFAFVQFDENWMPWKGRFYVFGNTRFDYDEFKVWDYRIAASGGVGYEFLKLATLTMRASGGVGFNHTWSGATETTPEGVIAWFTDWKIAKGIDFRMSHTYYPSMNDFPDFRLLSLVGTDLDVGNEGGLMITLGLNNEYDSKQIGNRNKLNYFLRLNYEI